MIINEILDIIRAPYLKKPLCNYRLKVNINAHLL